MLANISKRTLFIASGLIVISLVVAGVLVYSSSEESQPQVTETPQPSPTRSKAANVSTPNAQDYTKLVKEYEGYRIQFDASCQAIPKNVTYKNGAKILLDNRSGDARYVTVGGISYYLAGYGYKVITLNSKELPKTLLINCGAAVNVGQILLQK